MEELKMNEVVENKESIGVALPEITLQKIGMIQIFGDQKRIPVTVLKILPQYISQVKEKSKEGYSAVQVAFCEKKEKNVAKPFLGHLKKANIEQLFSKSYEVRFESTQENLGKTVTLGHFSKGDILDVTGISKGKGFQGVMKRYNFSGGPAAHGSRFHRAPGSIGNRATPARVFPEKKMPGHMGSEKVTVQGLELVDINLQEGFVLVRGSVPGSKNSYIRIKKSVKV